jgi:hypothetical protein
MVTKRAAAIVIAGVLGALVHAGCGGVSIGSICQKACDCTGCKGDDLQTCENEGSQAQQIAEQDGCGAAFDDELACLGGLTCKDHQFENTPCEHEIGAVETCVNKQNGGTGGPPPG